MLSNSSEFLTVDIVFFEQIKKSFERKEFVDLKRVNSYINCLENLLEQNTLSPNFVNIAKYHLSELYDICLALEGKKSEGKSEEPVKKLVEPKFTAKEINQEIETIIDYSESESEALTNLAFLAKKSAMSAYELRLIYEKKKEELEDNSEETAKDLQRLIELSQAEIDLNQVIPPNLATPLNLFAQKVKLRPITLLSCLLPSLAACLKVGTKILLEESRDFILVPNLNMAIVAQTGTRKSVAISKISTSPLTSVQMRLGEESQRQQSAEEELIARWENLSKEERREQFPGGRPKQEKKPVKACFATSFNTVAIKAQLSNHPDQAILAIYDELKALFIESDNCSGGLKTERQAILSMYDGAPAWDLRVDGMVRMARSVGFSILGAVQPDILRRTWKKSDDDDGYWSRFLFVSQPRLPLYLDEDESKFLLNDLLSAFYLRANQFQPIVYRLSKQAYQVYKEYHNYIEKTGYNSLDEGLTNYYSKVPGMIGKLCLLLHVIDEYFDSDREHPYEEISHETMTKAILLTQHYLSQFELLHELYRDKDNVESEYFQIIQQLQKHKKLTARDVKRLILKYRNHSPNDIRKLFLKLEKMGYAKVEGTGKHLQLLV